MERTRFGTYLKLVIPLAVFFVGFATGFIASRSGQQGGINRVLRENSTKYAFINPLLLCDAPLTSVPTKYLQLEKSVEETIDSAKDSGKTSDVSVYFRDLSSGKWFGINEDDNYTPHSLLKIVAMIAAFRENENNPDFMAERMTYTRAVDSLASGPEAHATSLVIGRSYAIDELVRSMIMDSDNGATDLLLTRLNPSIVENIYKDLTIVAPDATSGAYVMNAKNYSSFFRILYNSTYLTRDDSQAALSLLSRSTFKDGLRAGIPSGVVIAHKYGIGTPLSGDVSKTELHDCGIVYKQGSPYFLCVMSRGSNTPDLSAVVQSISNLVFQKM